MLRFSDGASARGATVQIQHTTDGVAYSVLTSVPVDAGGRWFARASLPASGRVRAHFAGDAAHPALDSAPASITVVPKLTLELNRSRVRSGTAIEVSGTYGPLPGPGRAQLVFERQVGKRWVIVQKKQINIRGGAFSTRVRPKDAGLHRVWITTPGASVRRSVRAVRG